MTSNHFFVPKSGFKGERVILSGSEGHHLSRVLRARAGEDVWLFDEEGVRYLARIECLTRAAVELQIRERHPPFETVTRLTLAQSILKAKAMDEVVEKAAELGVAAVIPVLSARSVAKIGDRDSPRKIQRWERIAREAAKQARTGRPPLVAAPRPLDDFLADCRSPVKIVLSEHGGRRLREILNEAGAPDGERPPSEAALVVGPEGGWTPAEEEAFSGRGFAAASLGRTILRAETAALAALAVIAHDWNW